MVNSKIKNVFTWIFISIVGIVFITPVIYLWYIGFPCTP